MKHIETRGLDFACVHIDLESGPAPPHVLFAHESPKMLSVFAVNPGKKHLPREGAPMFVQDVLGSKELLSIRRHGSNCSVFVFESAYHGKKKKTKTKVPQRLPRSSEMGSKAQMHTQQHRAAQRSFTSIDAGSFSLRGLPCSEAARADLEHGLGRILQKLGSELLPSWSLK